MLAGMTRKKEDRKHQIANESLVRVACSCGWFWRNDFLKNKLGSQLTQEVEIEFKHHVEDMEARGY